MARDSKPEKWFSKENFAAAFATTIRSKRAERGWSQSDLAVQADLSRAGISLMERGVQSPTLWAAQRMASAFGEPLSSLIVETELRLQKRWMREKSL